MPQDRAPAPAFPSDDTIRVLTGPVVLGGREVLAPMDLHLAERRIGVIGRNGSGKTTFLRLLAGLISTKSGQVTLAGPEGPADPWKDRKAALRRIGILFQNPDHQILFPIVEEELAFGLRQQGMDQKAALTRARAALEEAGRGAWASVSVATLSGGQKQWLCLLSILLMAPATILLDEPFSGLDLPTSLRLRRRLAALPQRLVTISHDPAAMAGVERLIWLEQGRIAADGPPEVVLPRWVAEMERLGAEDADADLAD